MRITRPVRLLSFGVPLLLDAWLWHAALTLRHIPPLLLAAAAAALTAGWPLLTLALLTLPAALTLTVAPHPLRARWRRRACRAWWNPWRIRGYHSRAGARSAYIPAWLRRMVYAADRHACVACGATAPLQVDHFMPWILGGLTSVWNCFTLCQRCNAVKCDYWRWRSGAENYSRRHGTSIGAARRIAAAERRARLNPARWWRAAWAL